MAIDPRHRREFEEVGLYGVRRLVQGSKPYGGQKLFEAREWIGEKEHGEERAHRRRAEWQANIALVISGLSMLVALVALFWKN